MKVDAADLAIVVGLLLLGIAVFMALGAAGVVGFAGAVLLVMGLAVAMRPAPKKKSNGAG